MEKTTEMLPVRREDAEKNIALSILLTLVTCGLYNIYWNYCEMKTINALLGRKELDFVLWLVLSIITCGLFHLYYEYKMGLALQEVQTKYGLPQDPHIAVVSLVLSLLGLTVVADAIQQHQINKFFSA